MVALEKEEQDYEKLVTNLLNWILNKIQVGLQAHGIADTIILCIVYQIIIY